MAIDGAGDALWLDARPAAFDRDNAGESEARERPAAVVPAKGNVPGDLIPTRSIDDPRSGIPDRFGETRIASRYTLT